MSSRNSFQVQVMDKIAERQEGSDVEKADYKSFDEKEEDQKVLRRAGLAQNSPNGNVKRGLKERHLQLIALGGTIGEFTHFQRIIVFI